MFQNDIQVLIDNYENVLRENGINYENVNENEDSYIKEIIQKYTFLKEINEKNNKKIQLYENIENDFKNLEEIKININKEVDKVIKEIKRQNKKEVKVIRLSDVFEEYKNSLKSKIIDEEEYQLYSDIFNKKSY